MEKRLPWWLILIVIIETLPMFVGPITAMALPGFMGGAGAEELNQATFIYLARNFAVGFAFLIALALRNIPMLFILIFIRLVTDIIDLPTLLAFDVLNNVPLTVSIFVFLYYVPAVFALWYLWRRMNALAGHQLKDE